MFVYATVRIKDSTFKNQIPKLTNIRWRDKTPQNKIMLENICNPLVEAIQA